MAAHCNGKVAEANTLSAYDEQVLNRIFNPNLPYSDVVEEEENIPEEELETDSVIEAKRLELEGVKAAEAGNVTGALDFFSRAIEQEPTWASGYNNRAQGRRLVNDNGGATDDLNKAIELSGGVGKAASQAYTQRALIHRLNGQDEESLEDFKRAANLGCAFAKQMVISLNPYAALCNQMMAEMIHKVKQGEQNLM